MDKLSGTAISKGRRNALIEGAERTSDDYHRKMLATAKRRKKLAEKRKREKDAAMYASND